MFIFFPFGFVSIVLARTSAQPGALPDPTRVQIRARVRQHLVALQDLFPALLGSITIIESPRADYGFRLICSKAALSSVLAEYVLTMQTTNVKNAVAAVQGASGRDYTDAVHQVWHVMEAMQVREQPRRRLDEDERSR
jgi:hypothetical protein